MTRVLYKDDISLTPRYQTAGNYGDITLRRSRSNMTFTHTTPDGQWDFTTNSEGYRNYQDFDYNKADYVVLGFFDNDYEDNLKAGMLELEEEGGLKLVKSEHIPGVKVQDLIYSIPGIEWLGENSYFYSMLFNATWEFYKTILERSSRDAIPTEYTIATTDSHSDYELELAAALIEELYKVTTEADAKLIILDIPRKADKHSFKSSILPPVDKAIAHNSHHFISSSILAPFDGVGPLHVASGGRHIASFSHTLFGTAAASWIQSQEQKEISAAN